MPAPIDPSGFNIYVRVRANGRVFNLWMNAMDPDPSAEFPNFPEDFFHGGDNFQDLPIVQSLGVELNPGHNGKINIEIGAPYDMGLALLNSQLFTIGNHVEVKFGYPRSDRHFPWFSGTQAKPTLRIDPDNGLSATLNIEGAGFAATRTSDTRQFRQTTYRQIVQTVAADHGWRVVFQPDSEFRTQAEIERFAQDTTRTIDDVLAHSNDPLDRRRESVSQAGLSDWRFIIYLMNDINRDVTIIPDLDEPGRSLLLCVERSSAFGRPPLLTFVSRGQVDFITRFPLLSFESNAEGVWLPRNAGVVRCSDVDPDSREEGTVEAVPEDSATPSLGETQIGEGSAESEGHRVQFRRVRGPTTLGQLLTCSPRDHREPAEATAAQQTEGQAMAGGIQASIVAIGIPELLPEDVINIENLGVFTGNYKIDGMTHQLAPGEWTMTLKLILNGMTAEALWDQVQAAPFAFNNAEPLPEVPSSGGGSDREPVGVNPTTGNPVD